MAELFSQVLDLKKKDVFLETQDNDTKYFSITGLPSTLSYGKHPFSITFNDPEGEPLLKNLSNIVFEFVDSRGTVIFSNLIDIEELSGAGNGFVWIKKDPLRTADEIADGPAFLTVMGELDGKEIPNEWKGIYNVRTSFLYDIRKDFPNTSPLVLSKPLDIQTNLSISETVELDKSDTVFKRSFINITLSDLETNGGKIESIELAYNEEKSKTDDFDIITSYPLTSGSFETDSQTLTSGLNPITNTTKIPTPKTFRRNTPVKFRLRFLSPSKQLAQYLDKDRQGEIVEVTSSFITFDSAPFFVEKTDNLLTGSLSVGREVGKGFTFSGKKSAELSTVDYKGFTSASLGLGPGILMYSGSVKDDITDDYALGGVGLELVANSESFFRFRTNPSELDIRTNKFFIGSEASQFVSASGGNIEISSSNFHLQPDGDVIMGGTITSTAGRIGGFNISSTALTSTPSGNGQIALNESFIRFKANDNSTDRLNVYKITVDDQTNTSDAQFFPQGATGGTNDNTRFVRIRMGLGEGEGDPGYKSTPADGGNVEYAYNNAFGEPLLDTAAHRYPMSESFSITMLSASANDKDYGTTLRYLVNHDVGSRSGINSGDHGEVMRIGKIATTEGDFLYNNPSGPSDSSISRIFHYGISGSSATTASFGHLMVGGGNFSSASLAAGGSGGSGISNVVEDTTPQLGGDLDLNGNDITGTGNIDIVGNITAQNFIVSSSVTSIEYQSLSGSTIFGDTADDTHTFLGNTISGSSTSTASFGRLETAGGIRANGQVNINAPFAQLRLSDDNFSDFMALGQEGTVSYIKTSDADNNFKFRRGSDNTDLFSIDFSDEQILMSGSVTASVDLLVGGDIDVGTGKIYGDNAYNNFLRFNASSSLFKIQNKTYVKFDGSSGQREVTINEGTNDIDFVVKGTSNNPLLHADANTNRIGTSGIGTPLAGLHLGDNLLVNSHITASGHISGSSTSTGSFGSVMQNGKHFPQTNAPGENIAFGTDAGSAFVGGNANKINVAIGLSAGSAMADKGGNVFIGKNAAKLRTTGDDNVVIGTSAGGTDGDNFGDKNVFIGLSTGLAINSTNSDGNVFIGNAAGTAGQQSIANVIIGDRAGNTLTDSARNVAIGSFAGTGNGVTNITTENGVYLGQYAQTGTTNANGEIVLGTATGKGSNTATIGGDNITDIYLSEDLGAMVHLGNISGSATSTGSFGAGYIDNKLGVGTVNPKAPIHIFEDNYSTVMADPIEDTRLFVSDIDGGSHIGIQSKSDNSGSIYFGHRLEAEAAKIVWDNSTDSMNFYSGSTKMFEYGVSDAIRVYKTINSLSNITTTGFITANDYITALGGIHVGGTSDPGTDNLVVDGNITGSAQLLVSDGSANIRIHRSSAENIKLQPNDTEFNAGTPKFIIKGVDTDYDEINNLFEVKSADSNQVVSTNLIAVGRTTAKEFVIQAPPLSAQGLLISGSSTSTGSFGHLMVGGGNFTSASLAAGGGSSDVVDDTSPQLGGNLDLNSNDITGTGNINIIGEISASSYIYAGDRIYVNNDLSLSHDGSSQLSVGFDSTYDKIRYGKDTDVVHEFRGTMISGSAQSTGSFGRVEATKLVGDGSGITGVTGEWDGTRTGTGVITGDFVVKGSDPLISASIASRTVKIGDVVGGENLTSFVVDDEAALIYMPDTSGGQKFGIGTSSPGVALEVIGDISGSATSTGSFGMLSLNNGGAQIAGGYTLNVKGHMTGSSLSVGSGVTLRDGALSIYNGGAQVIQLRHDTDQELVFRNANNAKNKLVLTDTKISGSATSTGSFGELKVRGSGADKISLFGNTTQNINFGDTDPDIGKISYDHNNNVLEFFANNTKILRVLGSGFITPGSDEGATLGFSSLRFSDVFAVQTTVGGIFEANLKTEKIGDNPTGTIVSWDEDGLVPCDKNEDELVMGVIKQGKDEPIVLGAEPVLVTGKVNVGDYIVTSDKIGHGKSVKRGYLLKKDLFGKVIAQALESCDGDSNLIKCMIRKM